MSSKHSAITDQPNKNRHFLFPTISMPDCRRQSSSWLCEQCESSGSNASLGPLTSARMPFLHTRRILWRANWWHSRGNARFGATRICMVLPKTWWILGKFSEMVESRDVPRLGILADSLHRSLFFLVTLSELQSSILPHILTMLSIEPRQNAATLQAWF